MITGLTNFTKKSFKNYTTTEQFKEKNIIFGYNGRGKSSLAKGIAEKYELTNGSIDGMFFFNKDYIKKNLLIQETQSDVIKGVIATFSEKEINVEEEIKDLRNEIQNEKALVDDIDKLENDIRMNIDAKHKERKGKLNISLKATKKDVEEVVSLYNNDIEAAKKIQSDENILILQQGDDSLEKEIIFVEAIAIPNFIIDSFKKEDLRKTKEILMKKYSDNNIPTNQIVEWLNQGLVFHNHESDCIFCQNKIDYEEIKIRITNYNEDVKQLNSSYLNNHVKKLNDWLNLVNDEKFNTLKSTLINFFNNDMIIKIFDTIHLNYSIIENFKLRLEYKISHMEDNDLESLDEFELAINEINEMYTLLRDIRAQKLKEIHKQNENLSILVKGAIGLSIRDDENIQNKLGVLKDKRINLEKTTISNEIIKNKILDLETKDSDHEDFRKFLNNILEDLQINMKLILHENNKNYTLIHSKFSNTPLTIDEISEGEKNLLALLFFYYQLYEDNTQDKLKSSVKLLIIDDPISSLDDANKYYVLELLKSILKHKGPFPQIFILTHVWEDFCQLTYGLKSRNQDPYGLFEVFKNENSCSEVRKSNSNISPYRKLFKEVSEFAQKDINTIDDCDIYHTPNSMRRVFEEFLQFKNSSEIIPTKNQQKKIEATIVDSTDGKSIDGNLISGGDYLSGKKKSMLGQLLIITNILSHSARHNTTETHQSANLMI